ncbi:hypothetical protein [Egbenema bharatensis]|uniref:hypothetical protein n=1 Tax=Egbenema bharatensis TaxID=3463334 RepID=UPI003A8B935B
MIGGASLSVFLLLVGWTVYNWVGRSESPVATENSAIEDPNADPNTDSPDLVQVSPEANPQPNPNADPNADPFADAVRLAEGAVAAGQQAQTPEEWQALAEQWQRASELMAQIPSTDPRYGVAQDRVGVYRQNAETALAQASVEN